MTIQAGSFLLSLEKNGKVLKVLTEESVNLWKGAANPTPCVKVLVKDDEGTLSKAHIPKYDLGKYRNITDEINALDELYSTESDDPDAHIDDSTKIENIELRAKVRELEKSFDDLKLAFDLQQRSLKEKQGIIDSFTGSPADIRKSADGEGVEDIRRAARQM